MLSQLRGGTIYIVTKGATNNHIPNDTGLVSWASVVGMKSDSIGNDDAASYVGRPDSRCTSGSGGEHAEDPVDRDPDAQAVRQGRQAGRRGRMEGVALPTIGRSQSGKQEGRRIDGEDPVAEVAGGKTV